MDIKTRKEEVIKAILRINDENRIIVVEEFLRKLKTQDYESNLKPMTVQDFNREIDQSLEDIARDNLIDIEDLKVEIEEWK